MGRWKKSKGVQYLPLKDHLGGLASGERSSGEYPPQQEAPTPTMSRSSRLLNKFKWRFRFPLPSPRVKSCKNTVDPSITVPDFQLLAVSASALAARPISLCSTNGPAPSSSCALHIPTCTFKVQAPTAVDVQETEQPQTGPTSVPNVIEPSPPSAVVWTKVLKIVEKKLSDNNLPPLDLTNLTSRSAEENIEAVIKALDILQEENKVKRWRYTWRGKEVIVMERLGKILRIVERYSNLVNTAIQSRPEVTALVWSSVGAIMRVRIQVTSLSVIH